MPKCKNCNGLGARLAFVNRGQKLQTHSLSAIRCYWCRGSGRWSWSRFFRYRRAMKWDAQRRARKETIRAAAQRLGVSPVELTSIRMGVLPLPPGERGRLGRAALWLRDQFYIIPPGR